MNIALLGHSLGTVALEFILVLRLNDSLAGEAGLIPLKEDLRWFLKDVLVESCFIQKTSLSSSTSLPVLTLDKRLD